MKEYAERKRLEAVHELVRLVDFTALHPESAILNNAQLAPFTQLGYGRRREMNKKEQGGDYVHAGLPRGENMHRNGSYARLEVDYNGGTFGESGLDDETRTADEGARGVPGTVGDEAGIGTVAHDP